MTIIPTTVGKNPLEEMEKPHNKRDQNAVLGCHLKMTDWSQGKPFNITIIQVYTPTSNAEEAEVERFYEDLPCIFNLYAEYIMRNAGLEEAQAGIKIAGRNINNLRYADDTTLMAESEEELKSLLMKVNGEWKS